MKWNFKLSRFLRNVQYKLLPLYCIEFLIFVHILGKHNLLQLPCFFKKLKSFYFQVIILLNGFVYFWNIAGIIVSSLGFDADNEIFQSSAFLLTLNIFNTFTGLPFSIYHTFVLEERHGFNKQVSEVVVWVWNNITVPGWTVRRFNKTVSSKY